MAGAEPAAIVARLTNWHTTEMRADAEHDEPVRLLDAVRVGLRVTQRLPLCVFSLLDFVGGTVADKDWLAPPLDNDLR